MLLDKQKVDVSQLQVGMFVSDLDRSWSETPFPVQGFWIKNAADVRKLANHCRYVYVDVAKSRHGLPVSIETRSDLSDANPANATATASFTINVAGMTGHQAGRKYLGEKTSKIAIDPLARFHDLDGIERCDYYDAAPWRQELVEAKEAMIGVTEAVEEMVDALRQGHGFKLVTLKRALVPMVSSIIRNPDACMWLSRLKKEDEYLYKHSVATSVWAVTLGRELGLPVAQLKNLAIGGLLLDIGKLKLPRSLLQKQGPLNSDELLQIHDHVQFSLDGLKATAGINREVWGMVAAHHERHNGLGYPEGLREGGIPLFARIAAIADCYDAMTSERPYAASLSPYEALRKLYEWRDIDFQAELIEEFIQAVGIYPAGSLVELNTGEVAMVVAEGRERRLRPRVLMLLDKNKSPATPYKTVNLSKVETDVDEDDQVPLQITSSLEMGAYGIDSTFIQQASSQLG